jgi:hypothetical protein
VPGRCQDPIPDLFGCFHPRVHRIGHADEDPRVDGQVFGDEREDPLRIPFACQLYVEGADLEMEQLGQQRGVVDVETVGGVLAWAGVHPDPGPFGGREGSSTRLLSAMKSSRTPPLGSSLSDSRPSVKSSCTTCAPESRQPRMSASASATRSSRRLRAGSLRYRRQGKADGAMTACFTGPLACRCAARR